jgi:hypothetical protein
VLWAPKWLPGRQEERKPFDVIERHGGLQNGEEVCGDEVTDLSHWLRERFMPRAEPSDASRVIIAGATDADDNLVRTFANWMQSPGLTVQPWFHGDPSPDGAGGTDLIAVLPWGAATSADLDRLLGELTALRARLFVLGLPGGDERAKNRFFRQGIYMEKIEAPPADPRAGQALLQRLAKLG